MKEGAPLLGEASDSDTVSQSYSTILYDDDNCLRHRHRGWMDQDAKCISTKLSMFNAGSISLVCAIATAVIAIANYRHYTNRAYQPESLLQSTYPSTDDDPNLYLYERPSLTLKDEPLSYKSPHELGVQHYNDCPKTSWPGLVF